jgi:hypothetical protein
VSRGNERFVDRDGLAFFGKLTASVTHELNNAFSIVDQTRGLLEDLVIGAASGRPIDPARIETIAVRIDRQVRKGVEILNCLNRFAHSLDDPDRAFDAGAETENLISLARRFAELKRVRLEFAASEEGIQGKRNAFLAQQAVFACLWSMLEESEEGDRIDVGVRLEADEAVFSVAGTARCRFDESDPSILRIADLMKSLDGVCQARTDEQGGTKIELRMPGGTA